MMPAEDLVAVAYRLGSKDAKTRGEAAQELQARGEAGLEALLAVWAGEKQKEERRGEIAAGVSLLFLGVGGVFVWRHWAALSDADAIAYLLVFAFALTSAILYAQPPGIMRLRKNVALALTHFDDPRVLLPLAQSLRLVTHDDPTNRAVLLSALRERLKREPDRQVAFPGTGWVLRWAPERVRRRVRWFWLWMELNLFMWPIVAVACVFFRLPAHEAPLGLGVAGPAVFTMLAAIGRNSFNEDVAYERLPGRHPWRALAWVAGVLFLIGLADHLVTGRPSWLALALATLALPGCLALTRVIDRWTFIEAPLPPAQRENPTR